MPRLSAFYGIAIFMYWDDHEPPHYHAIYAQHEALILLADRSLLRGSLPPRAPAPRPYLAPAASGGAGVRLEADEGRPAARYN